MCVRGSWVTIRRVLVSLRCWIKCSVGVCCSFLSAFSKKLKWSQLSDLHTRSRIWSVSGFEKKLSLLCIYLFFSLPPYFQSTLSKSVVIRRSHQRTPKRMFWFCTSPYCEAIRYWFSMLHLHNAGWKCPALQFLVPVLILSWNLACCWFSSLFIFLFFFFSPDII